MIKRLLNIRTREERIHDLIENTIRNIHSEEFNFTLEEQTDIIEGIQKAQFQILERKLSELELVKDQIDRITILSVND
jgi:hypothetical protein